MIDPATLLQQIQSTAPFLWSTDYAPKPAPTDAQLSALSAGPLGFLQIILRASSYFKAPPELGDSHVDYFSLCLAAHHATVATYVPTDVDTKIRGHLWQPGKSQETYQAMYGVLERAWGWDLSFVSRRTTALADQGPVSGHDGEYLSVIAGALGAFIRDGNTEYAEIASTRINTELNRELTEFEVALESRHNVADLLRVTMSVVHNLGDLNQGIGFWPSGETYQPYRARFARLAQEGSDRYNGRFALAAAIYRVIISPEGHRHYPLRSPRCLRRAPSLLLPLPPCLDDWGAILATDPNLSPEDQAEVVTALLLGCKKVPGQRGYGRALVGFFSALRGSPENFKKLLGRQARELLSSPEIQRVLGTSKESYEGSLRKTVEAVLKEHS